MRRREISPRSTSLLIGAVALMVAACGGGSSEADEAPNTTRPPATTITATTMPTATTAAPTTMPPTTSESAAPDQLALGEEIYQTTAGGVGCAACHGADGLGLVGPNVLGKSAGTIKANLEGTDAMLFIVLSDEEIEAVAAYLAFLELEAIAENM